MWPNMSVKRARINPVRPELSPPAPVRVVADWRSVVPSPAIAAIEEFLAYPHLAAFESKYGSRCPATYRSYFVMCRDAHRLRVRHVWRIETPHWRYLTIGSSVLLILNGGRLMDPRPVLSIHPHSLTIDYDGTRSHITQIRHVELFVDIEVRT